MASHRSHRILLVVVVVAAVLGHVRADADDRTNIPLKNWGGFSLYRDAVYDDLERLVAAGLADRAILNTKPINRTEAARMVARAIEKIRRDEGGAGYSTRRDLEPVLDRLMEEFRVELAELGVKLPASGEVPKRSYVSFTPVDRAQVRAGYTSRDIRPENRQGLSWQRGLNGGATFESRAQIGDFLTFYLQPELHGNEFFGQAGLATGYVKLTLFNVELLAGRDSLWWGPGYHGSLVISNNAPPLNHVRIGSAEPFRLPLVGDWIGPTKILAFFARLEDDPGHRHPDLFGMRVSISPFQFLELGASYANMFGGDDPPRLRGASDYFRVLFDPRASDQGLNTPQRFRNNALFAIDAELRFHDVSRFFIPAQDMRLYGEFGWDDTCCSSSFVPLKEATSYLGGLHLIGLLGQEGLDGRVEVASTSGLSFTHNQFNRGWWTQGAVLSHFIGTSGFDLFTRVTKRVTPNFQLGVGMRRSEIGNTANLAPTPREKRTGGSLDVTYRFGDVWSLFGQFDVFYSTNRNFVANDNGIDGLMLVELTRSFR
jgi:hypothetical protein